MLRKVEECLAVRTNIKFQGFEIPCR